MRTSIVFFIVSHCSRCSDSSAESGYYIYILASRRGGVLYIGVTNDLTRRVYEHREELQKGFSKEYHVHHLVHFEETTDVMVAIAREKELKKWKRQWKINLIEKSNPDWKDLYDTLFL